ncbi:AfsA-related hotdog domain-containing protein, partial [Streptomyces sp. NRRL S-1896]|uniref:AfsA-related hotdog domain-containing protein n=1 Tax=Streptomyces sp. NRRL S-1896 TaxID=1463893 RepID=UPI002D21D2AE
MGIEMVHRSRREDAFPQNWVRLGHDRFSVEALLPHDHPFFAPVAEDRHDPLLVAEDCIHGHSFWEGATIYPTQLGMAATWDPELVERIARATAVEVAATGV